MADRYELRLPALRIKQAGRDLYSFAVDGKRLHDFATVSRIHREDETRLKGYQRPEVLSHIRSIRRYLESTSPLLPNAIVIPFDDGIRFEPSRAKARHVEYATLGTLVIPVDEAA